MEKPIVIKNRNNLTEKKAVLFFRGEYGNFYKAGYDHIERNTTGMRFRKHCIIFCCLLLASGAVKAQTTTFEFLRNDVSARAAAMGGSFVSVTEDPSAVFYNPATLATVTQTQAQFGYARHLLDINSGFASYEQSVEGVGMMQAGVQYYSYGTMDETDSKGTTLGTFSAHDLALSIAAARQLEENLYYGAAVKFIFSSLADYSSTALGADLGMVYVIPGSNPISFGASLSNLGTQLSTYAGTKEDLPLDLSIGGTVKPQHLPLLLSLNFHKLTDKQDSFIGHFKAFTLGAELQLGKAVRFRAGYSNERRKELKIGTSAGMAGLSFGAGLVLEKFRFDYAYSSLGEIGAINRITLGLLL